MRFTHIDHIGIAVKDLDAAIACYTKLHGVPPEKITEVPSEQVKVAFFPVGPTKIELLAATSNKSPLAKSIAKRGEGLHHICYAVADFDAALDALRSEGFEPIARPSNIGAAGCPVAFFHPKETGGVLIEITPKT